MGMRHISWRKRNGEKLCWEDAYWVRQTRPGNAKRAVTVGATWTIYEIFPFYCGQILKLVVFPDENSFVDLSIIGKKGTAG